MRGLFSQSLSLIDQIIAEIPQKPEETAEFDITPTIVSESKYDHTMSYWKNGSNTGGVESGDPTAGMVFRGCNSPHSGANCSRKLAGFFFFFVCVAKVK